MIVDVVLLILFWSGLSLPRTPVVANKTINSPLGQERLRTITRQESPEEPYEIVRYSVEGKPIFEATPFVAGENWVGTLRLSIKNKQAKPITYMLVTLVFPETRISGGLIVFDFDIGHSVASSVKGGGPIMLVSGDVTTFEVTPRRLALMKNSLDRRATKIGDITKMQVWIQNVEFTDQTLWFVGSMFELDPTNPGKWRSLRAGRP